jgi:REP element-mobilizing transposase RayT
MARRGATTSVQFDLPFDGTKRRRPGGGRKPKVYRQGQVPPKHRVRPAVTAREPLHVVFRIHSGLPSLRERRAFVAVMHALRQGCERFGTRVVQFSVQRDHVHWIVESASQGSLARAMKGLKVRVARGVNRAWGRAGELFRERYTARSLGSPREVRNALVYVLANGRKHGVVGARELDRCSSWRWFDGWRQALAGLACGVEALRPVAEARSWLLRVGWRRHGALGLWESPRGGAV